MTDTVELSPFDDGSPSTASPKPVEAGDPDARLKPALDELDRLRLAQRGEFFFRIAVAVLGAGALCMAAGLATVGVLGTVLRDLGVLVFVLPPLAGIGLGLWANQSRRQYASEFKQQVLPSIAGALGDFQYDAGGKIGAQRLTGSTLLPPHDGYHSEDLFFGHHKGVEVALAEVKLSRAQGSGKDRKVVVPFKGLFVLLSTKTAISGKTVVRLDAGPAANWLGSTFGGLERYVPEGQAFDSRFELYTTEKAEARRLLTPALLERLTALAGRLGGALQAAFYEEQLFIMVANAKDLFEAPSIFTSLDRNSGVSRVVGEFRDVLAMIDGMVEEGPSGS